MPAFDPAKKGNYRVWLIEGGARWDRAPVYKSCWKAGGLTQAEGDVTNIEVPDPYAYNSFDVIGETQGQESRPTTSLVGRKSLDQISDMLRIARRRCVNDVQIHSGKCTNPSMFNTYEMATILELSRFTNYSTDEMGALETGEEGLVNETSDVSGQQVYEIAGMSFAERGQDAVVNPMNDVVICDSPSCSECESSSDGCEVIYAVNSGTTGSPGTPPDVVYSTDKGVTWAADDIDAAATTTTGDAIACLGDYVVVVSHQDDALYYKLKSEIGVVIGGWTKITTGIVASGSPVDAWSTGGYLFVVGDGGYIYGTEDVTAGLTVLDAGATTTQDLKAVHALDEYHAVATGAAGAVVYTEDRVTWAVATVPAVLTFQCVWMNDKLTWGTGSSTGLVYYTTDKGVTWTQKTLPGSLYSAITDIAFSSNDVGFISANLSTTKGRLLRSIDGGYSWEIQPKSGHGSMVGADAFTALAACEYDPNFVVTVGTNDNSTDGVIVVGND